MKLIKAGLSTLKAAQVVNKSEYVESKMTGNANFPTPSPTLVELTAARTNLVAALSAAESGAHADIAKKNQSVKNLRDLLTKMARYVNSVAGGDVNKAVSSGFELARTPEPTEKLEAPVELSARMSSYLGRIDLRWDSVRGARMYQVYMCDGDVADGGKWTMVGVSSRTKFEVTDLEANKFFSFRVAALGRIGEGPASEIVTAKAA
ncbi:MAG: fibronectin type III domain-containing protein [Flavobacteriales bacterium]|nr:fibronectin type III domain-containing protein [Flavobacteriales bacterium]